jgi:ribosomal-protein-alanine N-acetyltransferase
VRSEFRFPVILERGDVRLRLIQQADKAAWSEIKSANQEWLEPWEASNPAGGVRITDFRKYVRRMRSEARDSVSLPLVIEHRGQMVGQITLGNVVWGSLRQGYVGYWIDSRVAGRGIMPTALALLLDHAILYLQLHRIEINIRPENTASLRVVEKLGIPFEGLRRKYLHIAGDWRDHHAFVVIADEYPQAGLSSNRPLSH